MQPRGLTRADLVFLNVIHKEYDQSELPNCEQIRADVQKLIVVIDRLDGQVKKQVHGE